MICSPFIYAVQTLPLSLRRHRCYGPTFHRVVWTLALGLRRVCEVEGVEWMDPALLEWILEGVSRVDRYY